MENEIKNIETDSINEDNKKDLKNDTIEDAATYLMFKSIMCFAIFYIFAGILDLFVGIVLISINFLHSKAMFLCFEGFLFVLLGVIFTAKFFKKIRKNKICFDKHSKKDRFWLRLLEKVAYILAFVNGGLVIFALSVRRGCVVAVAEFVLWFVVVAKVSERGYIDEK